MTAAIFVSIELVRLPTLSPLPSRLCRPCRSSHSLHSADNRMKIGRVVRAANERPGRDVLETLFARDLAVEIELLWGDEFDDRQMVRRRPQILPHRQDLAADFAQIIHRLKNFRLSFTETEHNPALR